MPILTQAASTQTTTRFTFAMVGTLLLMLVEPALANKFETISGGVSGSFTVKREWLKIFFAVAGGVSLLGAVLAVVVPHRNALYLNYENWKQSALLLGIAATVFLVVAALI